MEWNKCTGEIWDYEKTFYKLQMKDGSIRWGYPNAGHLTDAGFNQETSGQRIPIQDVAKYAKAEDEYFEHVDVVRKPHRIKRRLKKIPATHRRKRRKLKESKCLRTFS